MESRHDQDQEERHTAPSSDQLGESGPGTPGYEGATAIGEEGASEWHREQAAVEEGGPLTDRPDDRLPER